MAASLQMERLGELVAKKDCIAELRVLDRYIRFISHWNGECDNFLLYVFKKNPDLFAKVVEEGLFNDLYIETLQKLLRRPKKNQKVYLSAQGLAATDIDRDDLQLCRGKLLHESGRVRQRS
jgi:hypothetical protein